MPNQPIINLQEKRDIGQVLNTTFAFIRLTYKYLYKDLLLLASPFFILYGLLVAITQIDIHSSSFGTRGYLFTAPMYYVALLCLSIGWVISVSIVGNYVLQYKTKRSTDFDVPEIRRAVRKDFFKLFFALILMYLALFFGFILLVIPGIYLSVAYSLVSTSVVLDKNAGISDSFSESRRLITDNWWRSLGLGIVVGLIVYAFNFVFSIPSAIYGFLIAMHLHSGDAEQYRLPLIIFSSFAHLSYCLTAPISVGASAVYYYSLKEEKDQAGLLERIDEMGAKENVADLNESAY